MSLQVGQMLSHYRLVEKIGEGGMGVVWKAMDTTLERPVALKLLPAAVAADADRVARFEREAKVLATLQHPNIASVFSVHRTGEAQFLAMELVAGEDLAQRLERGPLPVEDALAIARQVTEALEAAHAAGVVHRDLKPANVKVTPEGQAKVLDFGLAKALGAEGISDADLSLSPTVTAGTMAGMIMGTAPYMSPEQAKGRPVDRRSDLWSFGVMLWEMLTGRRLFSGGSVSEILAEVLKSDPDFTQLPEDLPPAIRRLLRRCLARDPKTRLHDAADARLEIDEAAAEEAAPQTTRPTAAVPGWRRALPWALAAAAIAVAFLLPGRLTVPAEPELVRFGVSAMDGGVFPDKDQPILDVSADGREVVFASTAEEGSFLYRRSLAEAEATRIEGTEAANGVFLSPDGRWVGFFAGVSMIKVPIEGGNPVVLAEITANRGASWGEDGYIVVTPTYNGGLVRVPDTGGSPEVLTEPDRALGERSHRWPQVVPGGRWVLFTVGHVSSPGNYDRATIDAVDVRTGARHHVVEGARMARFVAPDFLLFQRESSLLLARVDPERMELRGAPVSLVEGVGGRGSSGVGSWGASQTGALVFALETAVASDRLMVLADASGAETPLALPPGSYWQPRVSPDGKRIAFSVGTGAAADDDLWMYDLDRERLDRLTFGGGNGVGCWTPDGSRIAYARGGTGETGIYWKRVDGSGEPELLTLSDGGKVLVPDSFHPDGTWLLATEAAGDINVFMISTTTGGARELVLGAEYSEYGAAFSPDGRYLAYTSLETGVDEVFVKEMDGGGRWQISQGGGMFPVWSADGTRIYFSRASTLLVARVQNAPTFRSDPPEVLFSGPYELHSTMIRNFDVLPDGRFVLLRRAASGAARREISVVLGWPRMLDRSP